MSTGYKLGYKPLKSSEFFDKFKVILNLYGPYKFTTSAYSSKDNDVFIFEEEKNLDMFFQCPDYKTKLIPVKRNYIYKIPRGGYDGLIYKTSESKDGTMFKIKLDNLVKVYFDPYDDKSVEAISKSLEDPTLILGGPGASSDLHLGSITTPPTPFGWLTTAGITEEEIIEAGFNNELFEKRTEGIEFIKPIPPSILLEAEDIVNGERNAQYNDPKISFKLYSDICNIAFGLELSPSDVAKVMMAIKIGRQKHKHKRDNLVDLTGYTEILNRLLED